MQVLSKPGYWMKKQSVVKVATVCRVSWYTVFSAMMQQALRQTKREGNAKSKRNTNRNSNAKRMGIGTQHTRLTIYLHFGIFEHKQRNLKTKITF